jgi:hypothetical protein
VAILEKGLVLGYQITNMNNMNKKCDCKCHESTEVIYCSKCAYFHFYGTKQPPKPKPSPLWTREYMKQYYIKSRII